MDVQNHHALKYPEYLYQEFVLTLNPALVM